MTDKEEMPVVCNEIGAGMIAKMFLAGARSLEAKKEWINELNVFPVPDGDTGTNMTMTVLSAAREVAALKDPDMKELSRAIASGSLRGARGNSGVILSQLFRGFTKGIEGYTRITVPVFADAFTKAVETAYKAVMKPKEGTILTVARSGAERAAQLSEEGEENLEVFFREILEHMEYTLNQTPEILQVLAQAGVVDSGGQGLLEVLKGAVDAFLGKETDYAPILPVSANDREEMPAVAETAEIRFGYCTEFIIMTERPVERRREEALKTYLESIGDSLIVVADEEVIKVHVHTNDPGLAIQKALTYGQLSHMKIDNMRLEHQEKLFRQAEKPPEEKPHKAMGFVAVCAGEGLCRIFRELGADEIIEGGQTMNPSTEDMLQAIRAVAADTVFILPNNKNVVMAAQQARDMTDDKKVIVMPCHSVPQGITAIVSYVPELSAEENESSMLEEIGHVKTGQITYAVRDTSVNGREIRQGDYMGIDDTGIVAVSSHLERAVLETVGVMADDGTELLSIYYGKEVKAEDAEAVKEKIERKYPKLDIELQDGGQPVYYYLLSAE